MEKNFRNFMNVYAFIFPVGSLSFLADESDPI